MHNTQVLAYSERHKNGNNAISANRKEDTMAKFNKSNTATVETIAEQDATLTALATVASAADVTEQKDDSNEIVMVTLNSAHKTPTAIIAKKGSTDSVDGKERWFAKKDLKSFSLVNGKWQISAPKRYFSNKLVAYTEASE